MRLRREFENFAPALKAVASRYSRGLYKKQTRGSEPSITDVRGELVRSIETAQTFLNPSQVDELVALYEQGMSLPEIGRKLGVYRTTVAAHLARRSVPLRTRGLMDSQVPEAIRLYEGGMTLMEVGQEFGVSQGAVRRAVAAEGIEIRPRGRRRPALTV